jgi:hypothetical protein
VTAATDAGEADTLDPLTAGRHVVVYLDKARRDDIAQGRGVSTKRSQSSAPTPTTSQQRSHILGKPRTKGNTLNGTIEFIRSVHPACWPGTLDRLSPEQRAQVTGLILAGGWYPFELFRDLLHAFCAEVPLDATGVASSWGAYVLERDVKGGIYRVFLNVASPRLILKAFGRLWGLYHETGAVEVVEERDSSASCLLHGLHLPSRPVCIGSVAAAVRIMELAGGHDVKSQILSGAGPGDRYCAWELSWQ